MIKIKVIIPNSGMDRATLNDREKMLSKALSRDALISVDCIKAGPKSIESNFDEVIAGAEIVKEAILAEKEGFSAIVIYCFSDPAIEAVRENVSIPVIGSGEVTLSLAQMLSNKFTVVTTTESNKARTYRRLMRDHTAKEKMVSVRALNIPVAELRDDPTITMKYIEKICEESIKEDDIDTIILGCTGLAQYGEALEKKYNITVLDPSFLAVSFAEMCARLKIKHNIRAFANRIDL